jgi:hypothetical protein
VAAYRDAVRRKQLQMESDAQQIVKLFEDATTP